MPLADIHLDIDVGPLPRDVRSLLREADRRIEVFQRNSPVPGFVPCDFEAAFRVLRTLSSNSLSPGTLFCEWGSGFGVVACLAAMLDYDAYGIEIETELVSAARLLAADFEVPVQYVRGSFIPTEAHAGMSLDSKFAWLSTTECGHGDELGLAVDDFGVVFAYPWPDEEEFTAKLFEKYAQVGALLVTHHGSEQFRIRRKRNGRKFSR